MVLDQAWRPNWCDMNQGIYPDHGDDLSAWAWEYVRRNPEYQADYAQWAELPDTDGEGNHSLKYGGTIGHWVKMKFCASISNLPPLPEETVGEYERRTGQWVDTLYRAFHEKWLASPTAPSSISCPAWEIRPPPYSLERLDKSFVRNYPMLMNRILYSAAWDEEEDPFVQPVGFDLRFKVDDQWAAIRATLLECQNKKEEIEADKENRKRIGSDCIFPLPEPIKVANRNVVSKLGDHETKLRYLDAVAAAASDAEIINKLYPGESARDTGNDEEGTLKKNATKWLSDIKKAANELMATKYRTMILFDSIPKAEKTKAKKN